MRQRTNATKNSFYQYSQDATTNAEEYYILWKVPLYFLLGKCCLYFSCALDFLSFLLGKVCSYVFTMEKLLMFCKFTCTVYKS